MKSTNKSVLSKTALPKSKTYIEGSLIKQVGSYSTSLDKGAPNMFNNKRMIIESLNQVNFNKFSKTNSQNKDAQTIENVSNSISNRGVQIQGQAFQTFDDFNFIPSGPVISNRTTFSIFDTQRRSASVAQQNLTLPTNPFQQDQQFKTQYLSPSLYILHSKGLNEKEHKGTKSPFDSLNVSMDTYKQSQNKQFNKTSFILRGTLNNTTLGNDKNQSMIAAIPDFRSTLATSFNGFSGHQTMTKSQLNQSQRVSLNRTQCQNPFDQTQYNQVKQQRLQLNTLSSKGSKDQYQLNRKYRQTSMCGPKSAIDTFQSPPVPSTKLLKNTQTGQFIMREDRQFSKQREQVDLINHGINVRPQTISNGRCRYISDFYEQSKGSHLNSDFQSKLDNMPTLFGKPNSDFNRLANATPHTKLIIRQSLPFNK